MNNSGASGVLGNSTNSVILGSSGKNGTLSYTGGATLTVNKTFTMAAGGTGVLDVGTGGQLTVGVISGSGALSKTGAGNLVLGSSNTYSGGTTLGGSGLVAVTVDSAGTAGSPTSGAFGTGMVTLAGAELRSGASTSRTVANAITISADTTFATVADEKSLTFTGPVTLSGATRTLNVAIGSTVSTEKLTFSGAIGDGGNGYGITKTGNGTLVLSGNNTYSGATTISAGTLQIGAGGTNGSLSSSTSITNNANLVFNRSDSLTVSNAISGTGNLTQAGAGTLVLTGNNTYSGNTTISAGTLQLGHANALGATTSGLVVNGTLDLNGNSITKSTLSGSTGNITSVSAATLTFNRTNAAIGTYNGTIGGDVALSITNSNTSGSSTLLTLGGSNTYTGNTTIYNSALAITNGAALGNSTVIVQKGGQSTADYGGQIRLSGGITVSNNMTLAGQGYGGYTGALRNNSGNNTYTGTITIAASETTTRISSVGGGTLSLNGTISLGAATYGNLFQHAGGDIRLGGNGITGSATSFNVLGGGSNFLITDRANAWAGTTGLTLGSSGSTSYGRVDLNGFDQTISSISAAGTDTAQNIITNRSGTLATLTVNSSSTNSTFAGTLSGNLALTKAGSSSLILTANNTYTGTTTISAGNLSISTVSAVGSTSGINLANATTLIYTGGAAATLDRAISVTGTTGSTGTIRNESAGLLTLSGTLSKNGTTLALQGGNGGITVSGSIVGSNANSDLIIDGGSVTLAAANTYNGPTSIINGGTLNANTANALPTQNGRTAVSIDATGTGSSTLALGASQSIASLSGAASSNVTLSSNTLTIGSSSNAVSTTYAGRITGGANSALVKDGASTQILTGNNTGFTGTTTINSGTLQAAAANALGGTTQIDVNGGSLLVAVANAVNCNANINLGGGTLAVSGNFNQNVGLLTLSADSVIDLNGFSGILRFGGVGSWASSANLAIWNWKGINQYGTPVGDGVANRNIVFTNAASPNDLTNYLNRISFYSDSGSSFVGNAFEKSFTQSGFATSTEIIAVPETETYITAVILLLGFGIYQLRLARQGQGLLSRLTFLRQKKS
jgi:autotransporter-associated beta strand protein